ncbi:MAG: helix-turn-helix domain-containing protein [Planctomycetia bacterium]|nr:helix-turn-helix domain-containing protein [Planctomycetia bacterium]
MAQLISMEEAAAMLGVSVDELNQMRERRDIFGIRDGQSWKFKKSDVESYKARFSGGSPSGVGSGVYNLPVTLDDKGEEEKGSDQVLLSEEALGESGPTTSTIIGKTGEKAKPDSDLKLAAAGGEAPGSGVSLVPDSGTGSDVKLVPSGSSGSLKKGSSDLELVDLEPGADALPLDLGSSKTNVPGGSSKRRLGGEPTVELRPGSDLTLDSDLNLTSDLKLAGDTPKPATGSSAKKLGDSKTVFEDDDLVLGAGSGTGSGPALTDSGINLMAAKDSGLNLEEPLTLGAGEKEGGGSGSAEIQELSSDDDFLLTPMLELDDQESDSSGSQVIALDTEEPQAEDQAPTLLGEDVQTMGVLQPDASLAMGAAQPIAGPMMMGAPMVAQARYGWFEMVFASFTFIFVALTGVMVFEMARNMWSWDGAGPVATPVMDAVMSMFK